MTPRLRFALYGALAGLAFGALFELALRVSPSLFGLEWLWSDHWTSSLAAELPPDPAIAIVTVGEKSISSLEPIYGRPPWSREAMARALEEIRRGGARLVIFDILFAEENINDPAGDRRFAAALESMPAVLSAQVSGTPGAGRAAAWAEALWEVDGLDGLEPEPLIAPHPMFTTAGAIGSMRHLVQPGTSVVRSYSTLQPIAGGGWVPSLAFAAAARLRGTPHEARVADGVLRAGELAIPIDSSGSFLIRWRGARGAGDGPDADEIAYPTVDFDRVILASLAREDGSIPEEEIDAFLRRSFDGRIVLVGYTAAGLFDLRPTPLTPIAAGVEIHANALDNLLHADFNRPANAAAVALLTLLSTAILGGLAASIQSQPASLSALVLFAGSWLAAVPIALRAGTLVPAVGPALALFATWITITLARYVAERRRGVVMRATFGRYVSPQVLEYLLANPDKVRLGGERRDLTILFSDIRGFTSISEASEPEEVVEMLNEYLTRMVEILLRHGGTLDKFIGDAVMGFWNAPTPVAGHPRRAVECAIEMMEATAELRREWESEGKASLRIGIGINTGEAVVGNIGSSRVFGYTVIGDAVNLASRLEGKNKDYGTGIIISESTRARMGEDIPAFYLDEVRVKGKQQAVKIYEIRGRS
ncbi:MAG TPA: adenylate/guanylate cyclase domain-containing protein [Thermoanaerobaculia bacterium]|nr:adenylate/guanylate cyclase domain-containing protein [Thermoanaerobaculia bacterium]